MARRAATAERGKTGADSFGGRSRNAAATTLMRNAGVSSREIARRVREERCEHGQCNTSGARPSGRARRSGRGESGGAPPKVEVSETASGQSLSGTRLGRSRRTTGDEAGSCRSVTGTEYLGAEVFQEFCAIKPEPAPNRRAPQSQTAGGQSMTGTQVGRAPKITGNESGAGRMLTGTPYTSPAPEGAPPKVGRTQTLSGGQVTGSLTGRRERLTGNEPGTCQRVTGDEYLGAEDLRAFCKSDPSPSRGPKVGVDATWHGQRVSGTLVGPSSRVTGDEAGLCERVTGTAYLGATTVLEHCALEAAPALAGEASASASKSLSPMFDQALDTENQDTENQAATPESADFPQPLDGGSWEGPVADQSRQSARLATPAPRRASGARSVTGTACADSGHRVTGPFNMASNRVTGTEDFRSRHASSKESDANELGLTGSVPVAAPGAPKPDASPTRPRITGEGMDGGLRITGDDWGRGKRVTGTEGRSAVGRNPTRRGAAMGPFAGARAWSEQPDAPEPAAPEPRITGASGGTDRGARVTLSGGARG